MIIVCLRTVIAYGLIILMLRIMGKRQLGELQPSELVTTILISNLASLPIENVDLPIVTALLPILIIVSMEILLSLFSIRSQAVSNAVSGSPKVVIRDGIIDQQALAELRFSIDDLLEALRNKDVFDYREVAYGIVETNGTLNVFKRFQSREIKNEIFDLKHSGADRPPITVVMDGVIQTAELEYLSLDTDKIHRILKTKNIELQNVYLMQFDADGRIILIEKEETL